MAPVPSREGTDALLSVKAYNPMLVYYYFQAIFSIHIFYNSQPRFLYNT